MDTARPQSMTCTSPKLPGAADAEHQVRQDKLREVKAGHDGTWGVKAEYFEQSMKIGRPVFKQMAEAEANYISSDCAIAGRHICQGIGEHAPEKAHPLTLVRIAYGL